MPAPSPAENSPTLAHVLRWRAQHERDRRAFIFLKHGASVEEHITYGELDKRAQAIASHLLKSAPPNARVLLLMPPGLDYIASFFGCMYAGLIAVPAAYPSRLERALPRIKVIIEDCKASVVLCSAAFQQEAVTLGISPTHSGGEAPLWIAPEALGSETDAQGLAITAGPHDLAFLQYTSGSTSAPKGVMVSHANLLHTLRDMVVGWGQDRDSVSVSWLPIFHDLGLIYGVLDPVLIGHLGVLMSPADFLQRPLRWLEAVTRFKATHSAAPNFAFDLCVQRTTAQEREQLDLSSLRVVLNAAEPIRVSTVERFQSTFADCGLAAHVVTPGFGLAEATLKVSTRGASQETLILPVDADLLQEGRVSPAPGQTGARRLVGCGQAALGTRVEIVDPQTCRPCPPDRIGEIWVSGSGIAQGYWERPEQSRETFGARIDGQDGPAFMRTGDLGFVYQGQLFVTGRLKDLLIIDGRNHYPQDLELTVEQVDPRLKPGCGAAFAIEVDGAEYAVAVHEVQAGEVAAADAGALDALALRIAQTLTAEHELPVHAVVLIQPGSLPKTSSGKIQRRACHQLFLKHELKRVASWQRGTEGAAPGSATVTAVGGVTAQGSGLDALCAWMCDAVARAASIDPAKVDVSVPFARHGLTSRQTLVLAGELEQHLGRPVPPTLFWDFPSIVALASHLCGAAAPALAAPVAGTGGGAAGGEGSFVAIVGIGCRFPGAPSPDAFWRLLTQGQDAITEVPADRWDVDALYDADKNAKGRMSTRFGGFIDDVDGFDPAYFGLSPRETAFIDPQQRLLLEVSAEALADAGLPPQGLAGRSVGVFVGISNSDHGRHLMGGPGLDEGFSGPGMGLSIAANRISYQYDLRGPSLAVDTACSSSLVAIQLACESLRAGHSEVALAGGVNLILSPELTTVFSKGGFMSPDGRCKSFDASANGYVRSEGAGLLVLKPLDKAVRDGDRVYAVIRGGAVNQDGRTNGLTAPNRLAQEAVLRQAYRDAGILPSKVSLIEAHGTGTPLGDPIEAQALMNVVGQGRAAEAICLLGSVKSNIGHLEPAAGVAGVIKVALSLHHGQVPPSIHFDTPNPLIPFDGSSLAVARELTPWPASEGPRVAGVSSFGFGGTNAHLVLQEAPPVQLGMQADDVQPAPVLVPLSAHSPEAVRALAAALATRLQDDVNKPSLQDIAFTLSQRRDHGRHRAAVIANDRHELADRLHTLSQGQADVAVIGARAARAGKVAFVFCGQGVQRPGMGLQLAAHYPVAAQALALCDALVRDLAGWSLLEELRRPAAASRLGLTEFAQPAIVAVQWTIAELLRSWGVTPAMVIGHSVGEIAAACVAGSLSIDQAMLLSVRRGQAMGRLQERGCMVALRCGAQEAAHLTEGLESRATIAAYNGPQACVLAVEAAGWPVLEARLKASHTEFKVLPGGCAFHSPQMDEVLGEFEQGIRALSAHPPVLPWYSTWSAEPMARAPSAEHWLRQARDPVRFEAGLARLLGDGADTFVEIGPHPVFALELQSALERHAVEGQTIATLRQKLDEPLGMLNALGQLQVLGHPIAWDRVNGPGTVASLPSHAWQRSRFPRFAGAVPRQARDGGVQDAPVQGQTSPASALALLGKGTESALNPGLRRWEVDLTQADYLLDHVIGGKAIFPAAAYVEAALEAATDAAGGHPVVISDLKLLLPLNLPLDGRHAQIELHRDGESRSRFVVSSIDGSGTASEPAGQAPVVHARGECRPGEGRALSPVPDLATLRAGFRSEAMDGKAFHRFVAERGAAMGPRFCRVAEVWWDGDRALSRVELSSEERAGGRLPLLHPVLLDGAIQTAGVLLARRKEGTSAFVPMSMGELRWAAPDTPVGNTIWAYARCSQTGAANSVELDVLDETGRPVATVIGLTFAELELGSRPVPGTTAPSTKAIRWERHPLAASSDRPRSRPWLVLAGRSAVSGAITSHLARHEVPHLVIKADDAALQPDASMQALRGIVHRAAQALGPSFDLVDLRPVDAFRSQATTGIDAAGSAQQTCVLAMQLTQAVLRHDDLAHLPRMRWITRDAQSVVEDDRTSDLSGSPLASMLASVSAEHPELEAACVDLGASWGPQDLSTLISLLESPSLPIRTAVREGQAWQGLLGELAWPKAEPTKGFNSRAAYWITGGWGSLGLQVARWMVGQGARHLVLTGRSAPGPEAMQVIEGLRRQGATVRTLQADVGNRADVEQVLAVIEDQSPPLAGVLHAAGVLEDARFLQQTPDGFAKVFASKAAGAWNLHQVLGHRPLELFVLFSSLAASLASAGQANYAAANGFLDALARGRRASGLPALSIGWGPWAGGGMAQNEAAARQMRDAGIAFMEPRQALDVLGQLLSIPAAAHVVVTAVADASAPLGQAGASVQGTAASSAFVERLREAPARTRGSLLQQQLTLELAQTLQLPLDKVDISRSMPDMGMESLMALEFKSRLERLLGLSLPATLVWTYTTVGALTRHLAERLKLSLDEAREGPASTGGGDAHAGLSESVASLTDEEAEEQLRRSIAELENLSK